MSFNLKGKNIIVTGASGFLGSHVCGALNIEGANIIGIDINPSDNVTRINIADSDDVDDFVADLASHGIKIDGLVNNAAVNFRGGNTTDEEFDITMSVNIKGQYNCITKIRQLIDTGSIVNVSSIFGLISPDFKVYNSDPTLYSSSVYGAAKAGLAQLTRYYAVLYGRFVRVNSVSPGGIWQNHTKEFSDRYSERVPMKRMADVKEIVNPILFLLSPLSSYITGHNLVVDGGLTAL